MQFCLVVCCSLIVLIEKIKKKLPIFFISGKADPVGAYGKGVLKGYRMYKKAGLKNVKIKLYAQMRHEVLNDIEKEKVYLDICKFIESIYEEN